MSELIGLGEVDERSDSGTEQRVKLRARSKWFVRVLAREEERCCPVGVRKGPRFGYKRCWQRIR